MWTLLEWQLRAQAWSFVSLARHNGLPFRSQEDQTVAFLSPVHVNLKIGLDVGKDR
jgi:hypothetical protein